MKQVIFTVAMIGFLFIGCGVEEKTASTLPKEGLGATPYAQLSPLVGQKAMLLEFGSTTCASCVEMGKLLRKVKDEHPQSHVYFIEVYNDQHVMRNYGVQMIPTQIYLNEKGEEVDRHIGVLNYEQLVAKLRAEKII
jgi:thioredoxin 1